VPRRGSRRSGWAGPALLGGAGLVVGAFAPCAVIDYWGSVSLHDVAPLQAVLVAAAGAAALLAAPLRRPKWVRPAALLAWLGALLPLIQNALAPEPSFLDRLGESVVSSVSDQLGQAALELAHPQWGCVPLAGGLLLLSVAGWRSA
jgi:hypothetical protein